MQQEDYNCKLLISTQGVEPFEFNSLMEQVFDKECWVSRSIRRFVEDLQISLPQKTQKFASQQLNSVVFQASVPTNEKPYAG